MRDEYEKLVDEVAEAQKKFERARANCYIRWEGFNDVRTIFEQFTQPHELTGETKKTVSIRFNNPARASNFRRRCYKFRAVDRERSFYMHPADHPMRGISVYENLELTVYGSTLTIEWIDPPIFEWA